MSPPATTPEPSYICGKGTPIVLNAAQGEILSPEYPNHYPIDAKCQWHIHVPDGTVVKLFFVELNLEDG